MTIGKRESMALRIVRLETRDARAMRRPSGAQPSDALNTTIEARTIIIVTFTDDLSAAHDDTSMAIVKRRQRSLLEAKRKIDIVTRHCGTVRR